MSTKQLSQTPIVLSYLSWWGFWFVIQVLVLHRLNINWYTAGIDSAVSNLLLALAGYIILNTYRFYSPRSINYIYRFGYILVLTIILIAVLIESLKQLNSGNTKYLEFLDVSIPARFMYALLMVTFMAVFSGLRFYMKEQEENKRRKNEADLLVRDAELANLRQQLQPHFLFNSLNSISALAVSQPHQARTMIQQLSDFLRGTLKKDDKQLVLLHEEIAHLQLYLEIEKVRFGHRLITRLNCDEKSMQMNLPSLLLQPLVENAIKFGLYDTIGEITISLEAEGNDMQLKIKIVNPFDAATAKPKKGNGFGLNSVQRRLYLLYGRNDLLSTSQSGNLFITSIVIPQTV